MIDKSKGIHINGFDFEIFPVENYLSFARTINGLIDCPYDHGIVEDGEANAYSTSTTYWMKKQGLVLGILRYTKFDNLGEILTADHSALTVEQLDAIAAWTKELFPNKMNNFQYRDYLIPDINGKFYHYCRLPDGITLNELDLSNIQRPTHAALFRFPKNLTVNNSVTSRGNLNNFKSKLLPDGLTIHGNLDLDDIFPISQIGNNVNISGKLTMHAPYGFTDQTVGTAQVGSLLVFCDDQSSLPITKLPFIKGDAYLKVNGSIENVQCGGSLHIDGKGRGKGKRVIDNIQCSGSLSIVNHEAEEITRIQCQDLLLYSCTGSILDSSFIPGNLTIRYCPKLKCTAKHLVCSGNLEYFGNIGLYDSYLPLNTLVMGHAKIGSNLSIPESFCFLGGIEWADG